MPLPPAMLDPIKEPARPGRELQRRDPEAGDGAVTPTAYGAGRLTLTDVRVSIVCGSWRGRPAVSRFIDEHGHGRAAECRDGPAM
jgi:hypothetical protein